MAHLLTWPKNRRLSADAYEPDADCLYEAEIEPGRLTLRSSGGVVLVLSDPDELRAFAMQVYVAALDFDQSVQHAAAKASADRRQRRKLAGLPTGVRHQPYDDDNVQPSMLAEAVEASA